MISFLKNVKTLVKETYTPSVHFYKSNLQKFTVLKKVFLVIK